MPRACIVGRRHLPIAYRCRTCAVKSKRQHENRIFRCNAVSEARAGLGSRSWYSVDRQHHGFFRETFLEMDFAWHRCYARRIEVETRSSQRSGARIGCVFSGVYRSGGPSLALGSSPLSAESSDERQSDRARLTDPLPLRCALDQIAHATRTRWIADACQRSSRRTLEAIARTRASRSMLWSAPIAASHRPSAHNPWTPASS